MFEMVIVLPEPEAVIHNVLTVKKALNVLFIIWGTGSKQLQKYSFYSLMQLIFKNIHLQIVLYVVGLYYSVFLPLFLKLTGCLSTNYLGSQTCKYSFQSKMSSHIYMHIYIIFSMFPVIIVKVYGLRGTECRCEGHQRTECHKHILFFCVSLTMCLIICMDFSVFNLSC